MHDTALDTPGAYVERQQWRSQKRTSPHEAGLFQIAAEDSIREIGRSDWNRTSDLLVPNETRYQAALRSVVRRHFTEKPIEHNRANGKNLRVSA